MSKKCIMCSTEFPEGTHGRTKYCRPCNKLMQTFWQVESRIKRYKNNPKSQERDRERAKQRWRERATSSSSSEHG